VNTGIWTRSDGPGTDSWVAWLYAQMSARFGISPEEGAVTAVWLATSKEAGDPTLGGKYWERNTWKWLPGWMNNAKTREAFWKLMARDAGFENAY
jgi:hypothetical protein